jgi:hypothetical protein
VLIAISTADFNPLGHVLLDALESSNRDVIGRRVTRRATLDGGVTIIDGGFAHGDRTMTFEWEPTGREEFEQVQDMMIVSGRVVLATIDGVFDARIEQMQQSQAGARITLLIESKLSA